MCGINGFTYKDEDLIKRMNQTTAHRGPDGVGFYSSENISLGHNLLAITETPHKGEQPWCSEDSAYVMVYNGEIYNYRAIRAELEAAGEVFRTNGDTEVLFKGLCLYGESFLNKLDGMFALAFYDSKKQTLTIARDRSGMKPVYYCFKDNQLFFSSELRGVLIAGFERKLNVEAAQTFFFLGYLPGKDTLIKNIYKLCPGQKLTYDLVNKSHIISWLDQEDHVKQKDFDPVELVQTLNTAVMEHTMGLRPFGLFLSGGLDSTIVLHELAKTQKDKINTFTTRFETNTSIYNEDANLAFRLTSDYNINHTELMITENDFIAAIPASLQAMEEPRFNPSVASYWLLMQRAAQDVTVILGGSGGDEQFLGYPRYLLSKEINRKYQRWPRLLVDLGYSYKAYQKGMLPFGASVSFQDALTRNLCLNNIISPVNNPGLPFLHTSSLITAREYIIKNNYPLLEEPVHDLENRLGQIDALLWLADEDFLRTDKLAMHFGIEGRFPLVARAVSQYAAAIASDTKIPRPYSKNSLKRLFREAYKNELPSYIINKKKTGWNAPITDWMHGKFGEYVLSVLHEDYYKPTSNLFNFDYLKKHFIENENDFTMSKFHNFLPVFYFQIWAREFQITL